MNNPFKIGLFQALGLTLYVSLFASVVRTLGETNINPDPIFVIIAFLLAFIISATICTSIALVYPLDLFFSDRKKEALQ